MALTLILAVAADRDRRSLRKLRQEQYGLARPRARAEFTKVSVREVDACAIEKACRGGDRREPDVEEVSSRPVLLRNPTRSPARRSDPNPFTPLSRSTELYRSKHQ